MNTLRGVEKMNKTIEKLLTTPTSLLSLNILLLNKPQIHAQNKKEISATNPSLNLKKIQVDLIVKVKHQNKKNTW